MPQGPQYPRNNSKIWHIGILIGSSNREWLAISPFLLTLALQAFITSYGNYLLSLPWLATCLPYLFTVVCARSNRTYKFLHKLHQNPVTRKYHTTRRLRVWFPNCLYRHSWDLQTRKLCYRKHDRAMRFCCTIVMQYRYDPAIKVRSSDVNKGAWQMPCRNYGLRPGLKAFAPKFLHVPLGVGGWPLGYEERRCWANCSRN